MFQSISDTIFGTTSSPSSPQSTNVNMSPRKRAQQAQSQAQSSMQSTSASKTSSHQSSSRGICKPNRKRFFFFEKNNLLISFLTD